MGANGHLNVFTKCCNLQQHEEGWGGGTPGDSSWALLHTVEISPLTVC